jgi:IPT/TIG domain
VLPILVTPVDDVPVVVVPQYQRLKLGSIGLDPLGSAVWGSRRVTLQLRVDSPASALALLPATAAAPAAVAAAFALVSFTNSTAAAVLQLGAFGRSVALSGLASDVATALALTDLTCVRAAGFSGGDAVHVSVVETDAVTGAALPGALAAEATLELWLSTLSSAAQSALPYIGSLTVGGDHSDALLLVTGGGFAQYATAAATNSSSNATAAAATPPLLCQYGSLSAPAAVVNDSTLLCPVPVAALAAAAAATSTAAAGGFHTLVRLTNGLDFWSNAVAHYIALAPQLLAVLPAAVPACGGSTVVLTAATAVLTANPVCIFGSSPAALVVVPAQWRTPQSVVCTVPQWPPSAAAAVAAVAVPVRLAAAHAAAGLASNAATLLFAPAPAVHSVTPLLGSSAGGSVLTLTGSGFAAGLPLVCSIGGVLSEPLAVLGDTELQCAVPARETAAAVAVPPYQLELASSVSNNSSSISGADDVLIDSDATALSLVSYC